MEPEGTGVGLGTAAAGDSSTKPIEAMTEDELMAAIADVAGQIDQYYDDGIDTTEIEPLHAKLAALQQALAQLISNKAIEPEKYMDALSFSCPPGMTWDTNVALCVPDPDDPNKMDPVKTGKEQTMDIPQTGTAPAPAAAPECPSHMVWDFDLGKCVTPLPAPKVSDAPKVVNPTGDSSAPETKDQIIPPPQDKKVLSAGEPPLPEPGATPPLKAAALELTVAELELINFQTEKKFETAKEEIAYLTQMNKQLVVDKFNLGANLKAAQTEAARLQSIIDSRDKSLIEKDKEIARIQMNLEKKTRDYNEALEKASERVNETVASRDHYKTLAEKGSEDYTLLDGKYTELLGTSLAQTKKLTKSNEEKLELEEKLSDLRQQVKKMKRSAKVIVSM
jgi:hypothetical protein